MGIRFADHPTLLYPKKMALTSPTNGAFSQRTDSHAVCVFHATKSNVRLLHSYTTLNLGTRCEWWASPCGHSSGVAALDIPSIGGCVCPDLIRAVSQEDTLLTTPGMGIQLPCPPARMLLAVQRFIHVLCNNSTRHESVCNSIILSSECSLRVYTLSFHQHLQRRTEFNL